jgi:hypothetical protein
MELLTENFYMNATRELTGNGMEKIIMHHSRTGKPVEIPVIRDRLGRFSKVEKIERSQHDKKF